MKNENPFREKLYHHTLPVREDLWQQIESQLPVAGSRRKFPLLWWFAATLIVAAGIWLLLTLTERADPAPSFPPNEKSTPLLNGDEVNDEVSMNQDNNPVAGQMEAVLTSADLHRQSDVVAFPTDSKLEVAKSQASTVSPKIKNVNNQTTGLKTSKINLPENTKEGYSRPNAASNQSNFTGQIALLSSEVTPIAILNSAVASIGPILADPSCYNFTIEERKSRFSLDVFGGPGFSPRSFASPSAEGMLYSSARAQTEKFEYSYSAGARFNISLNDEIALRLGLIYEQDGFVFNYTDPSATLHSIHIDSFFAADGSFLYEQTVTQVTFGTLVKRIHNRFHFIDIPLIASYELPLARSKLFLNAGPVINLVMGSRGQMLDPGLNPKHITNGQPNQLRAYNSSAGLSFYLGAGVAVPFNRAIWGIVEPRILYRLKAVTASNYPLKEKNHYAGLNLGLRFILD